MSEDAFELAPEGPKKPRVRIDPVGGPPRPCPECGYDLRGARPGRCPECGCGVTPGKIERAARRQERRLTETEWFVPLAVLLAGVAISGVVYALVGAGFGGMTGVAGMLVALAVKLLVYIMAGWIVFFALSLWWFGFGHSIPITILQVAAVYAGAEAVSAVAFSVIPLPFVPWLITIGALMGLLCWLLDLEYKEAFAVAILSWLLKYFVAATIAFATYG